MKRNGDPITLRALSLVDTDLLERLQERPEVKQYLGSLGRTNRPRDSVFVIEYKGVGVGLAGIVESGALDGSDVELVCAMTVDAEGCGFATEACESVLAWARAADLKRVLASVHRDNRRANALLRRLGFQALGERVLSNDFLFEIVF